MPVIVSVTVPVVAVELAASVSVDVHVGLQWAGLKVPVTPIGSPETLRTTSSDVPETSVTVMVVVVLAPCVTLSLVGEAARE